MWSGEKGANSLRRRTQNGEYESHFLSAKPKFTTYSILFSFTAPVAAMDPICALPDAYKVRLCASLFAARRFKNKVKFLSDMEYVLPVCEKKEVSIRARIARLTRRNGRRIYDEWIMGCTALRYSNNEAITYYVSRGVGPNTIFVYTRSDGHDDRVSLYGLASNVSVADFRARAVAQDGRYLVEDVES
jgi:hypothetical protein